MSKIYGYSEGDRAEWLALYMLSTIGFVIPTPRQSDHFGTDAIIHLAERKEQVLLPIGLSFAVQIKSNDEEIKIGDDHLNWFYGTSLPFFFLIMDRTKRELKVFSAMHRIINSWTNRSSDVVVRFTGNVSHEQSEGKLLLNLGKPIVAFSQDDLDGNNRTANRKLFFEIMRVWSRIEQIVLAWRTDELPFAVEIDDYNTNEYPDPSKFKYPFDGNTQQFDRVAIAARTYLTGVLVYMEDVQTRMNESDPKRLKAGSIVAALENLRKLL